MPKAEVNQIKKAEESHNMLDVRLSQIRDLLIVLSNEDVLETTGPHQMISSMAGVIALVEQAESLSSEVWP
ncbi:MAG: hypothetical protein SH820_11385 [Xanthomonadales bacterium]|nr:hypothetical protein [Xanthomonadales bacterium]